MDEFMHQTSISEFNEIEKGFINLSSQDKTVLREYISYCNLLQKSETEIAWLKEKAYVIILQDRLRRLEEWRKVQMKRSEINL